MSSTAPGATPTPASAKSPRLVGLSREKMVQFKQKAERRGVVYLARVPPYMKPEKLRSLLTKYGAVNRIYLVPEDKTFHKKRVTAGGNRRQKYTEGWIEFEDKKVAKRVAKLLNTMPIGGRKRDYYHDDMWNLKYLKKFKWDHLTEKVAYDNRIRDQKLRVAIAQHKKENEKYLERVEQAKQFEKMDARKAEQKKQQQKRTRNEDEDEKLQHIRRTFQQKIPTSSKHLQSLGDEAIEKVFLASRNVKHQ
uniref:RRM domain-containing protein n=1 Tax=Hyaloperonospora arabidopsidis (strain Emoy2) TaxID=559515 RepID=M4BY25_HYAAE